MERSGLDGAGAPAGAGTGAGAGAAAASMALAKHGTKKSERLSSRIYCGILWDLVGSCGILPGLGLEGEDLDESASTQGLRGCALGVQHDLLYLARSFGPGDFP